MSSSLENTNFFRVFWSNGWFVFELFNLKKEVYLECGNIHENNISKVVYKSWIVYLLGSNGVVNDKAKHNPHPWNDWIRIKLRNIIQV